MSAFLFILSDNFIKNQTDEKLKDILEEYQKNINSLDWSKYEPCNFIWDQACGQKGSISKIEEELEQRSIGKNEKLSRIIVPGYNPAE